MKPKIKEAIALVLTRRGRRVHEVEEAKDLVLTRRGRRVHEGGRGRRVHGFAIIWKVLAGVALAAGAFAPSVFADPPEGGGVTVIEKLEVKWFAPRAGDYGTLLENGDIYFRRDKGCVTAVSGKGQVCFALSGSEYHAPGTIEVRMPRGILMDRNDGHARDQVSVGVSASDGWATRVDSATDELVIYNTEIKPPAMEYLWEVQYGYAYPYQLVDMAGSAPFQVALSINCENGNVLSAQSNAVRIFVDTATTVESVGKSPYRYFPAWYSGWGPAPADADDYFYVVYTISLRADPYTQMGVLTVDDIPVNGGELVGFGNYTPGCNDNSLYDGRGAFGAISNSQQFVVNFPRYGCKWANLTSLVRYPKSVSADGLVHEFTNSVVATFVGDDDHLVSSATNSTVFTYYGDSIVPPGELYSVYKWSDITFAGGINLLADRSQRVEGIRQALLCTAKCYETTCAPGSDPGDVSSYNQRTNTFELIDDFLIFGDAPGRVLTVDDYEIDALQFCDQSFASRGAAVTTNDLGRVVMTGGGTEALAFDEVKLWGKFGSDIWELVGTLARDDARTTGSLWQFLPARADASCEYNAETLRFLDHSPSISGAYPNLNFSKIILPENCTGIKLQASSAGSDILIGTVYVTYSFKPSDFMKTIAAGSNRLYFYNIDTFVVRDNQGRVIGPYDNTASYCRFLSDSFRAALAAKDNASFGCTVGHDGARAEVTRLEMNGRALKTYNSRNNQDAKYVDIEYHLSASEFMSYSLPDAVETGLFQPQSSGTFYDLLPLGMEFLSEETEVKRCYDDGGLYNYIKEGLPLDSSQYEVSVTRNWRGTGRELVTIAIHDVEDNVDSCGKNDYSSGFCVHLTARYSYENALDFGMSPVNLMAYETGNDTIANGETDTGLTFDDEQFLTDLDGSGITGDAGQKYLYESSAAYLNLLLSVEASLSGRVRARDVGVDNWITGVAANDDGTVNLPPGAPYQYRIRTATQRDSRKANVILYDSIENYVPEAGSDDYGNPQWRGTLTGVDLSQLELRGVAPVVYYSTVPGLDIETHTNLADSATWSATAPDDLSTVTAVAIDCRLREDGTPFVLESELSLSAILNMRAPEDKTEFGELLRKNAHAYNQVFEYSTNISGGGGQSTQLVNNLYTKVGLYVLAYSNIHGLLKILSPYRSTIIPVPWTDYTRDGSPTNDIRVDRLVKPRNLTDGDLLLQYANGGVYKAWTLEKDEGGAGVWTPMTTVAQQPLVGGMTNVIASLGADGGFYVRPDGTETQKRGYGLWLVRQRLTDKYSLLMPFYLYGQWLTGAETVTIGGVDADDVAVRYPGAQYGLVHDTMLADPDCTRGTEINGYPWTGHGNADTLLLSNDTAAHHYCFRLEKSNRHGGGWEDGWWYYGPNGYANDIATMPGIGFWYERRAAGAMTHTWPGATKYPGDGEDHDVWIVDHADAGDGKTHLAIKLVGPVAPETIDRASIRALFDSGCICYLHASGETQAEGKQRMDELTAALPGSACPVPYAAVAPAVAGDADERGRSLSWGNPRVAGGGGSAGGNGIGHRAFACLERSAPAGEVHRAPRPDRAGVALWSACGVRGSGRSRSKSGI